MTMGASVMALLKFHPAIPGGRLAPTSASGSPEILKTFSVEDVVVR